MTASQHIDVYSLTDGEDKILFPLSAGVLTQLHKRLENIEHALACYDQDSRDESLLQDEMGECERVIALLNSLPVEPEQSAETFEVVFNQKMGSCGVSGAIIERLEKTFAMFTHPLSDTDVILDATGFDLNPECHQALADIIGEAAANSAVGAYVVFYVE